MSSTKIPVTLEGRLTADPDSGRSERGIDYAAFDIAVNERRLNEETNKWEDGAVVFHRVVAFGQQAQNVAASLRKGHNVVVNGDLKFGTYTNPETGETRETRQVIADTVGASLKFNEVTVGQSPKAKGPELYATGPVATPEVQSGAGVAR